MRTPHTLWIVTVVAASIGGIPVAADMFDDFEQTFPGANGKNVTVTMATSFPTPELPNPFSATKPSDARDSSRVRVYSLGRFLHEIIV